MHIGNNVGIDANVNYKSELGITGLGVDVRKEFLESNRLGSRERTVTNAFLEHHLSFFDEKLNITPEFLSRVLAMIKPIFIQELMQVLPMEILNFSGISLK